MESLQKYLSEVELTLNNLCVELNWSTKELTTVEDTFKLCPIDTSHQVSAKKFEDHVERCVHKTMASRNKVCDSPEEELSRNSIDSSSNRSVYISKELQANILKSAFEPDQTMKLESSRDIPKTHTDIMVNFTRDEKLALYKYVIERTGHYSEPEFKIPTDPAGRRSNEMSFAEILSLNRNLKRRRMKHRTMNLSYTDEIRGLIGAQMTAFEQYLNQWSVKKSKPGSSNSTVYRNVDRKSYNDNEKPTGLKKIRR